MAEEDWGELSIRVPKNSIVVIGVTLSINEDGSPKIGTAVHVPDKRMGSMARMMTPPMLQRIAQEIEDGNWTVQSEGEQE